VALTGQWYVPQGFGPGDLAMLVNATLAGLAYTLYFTLLDRSGPVVMSFVSFLNLAFVTAIGIVFFAERPSLWLIAAGAFIVAGLLVIQRSPRVEPKAG
jgi:drug/metabolite transporter (DMT)-like permease